MEKDYLRTSNSSYARIFLLDILYETINVLPLSPEQIQRLPDVMRLFEIMQDVFTNEYLINLITGGEDVWRHFRALFEVLDDRE